MRYNLIRSRLFLICCGISLLSCVCAYAIQNVDLPERNGDHFYYFGFGSNMLTKRIHIQNPSAVKLGMGILKDYRLDFNTFTERWGGAPATIVPTAGAYVYGTLWQIDMRNLADIDDQEGVREGIYYPVSLPIMLSNQTALIARAYLLTNQPKIALSAFSSADALPLERQPSKTYLQCLVKGAQETGIVPWYIDWLKSVQHNGYVAKDLEDILELKEVELASK